MHEHERTMHFVAVLLAPALAHDAEDHEEEDEANDKDYACLLYTSPSPRDRG